MLADLFIADLQCPSLGKRARCQILDKLGSLACVRLFPCPSAVLKLLKMAKGMRALLDTVMQALPQVNVDLEGRWCFF